MSPERVGARVALTPIGKPANVAAIEIAARTAIEELGGLPWLKTGDRVLIKPVSNSPNPYPAVTRPELAAALVRILRAEGAGQVIVADHPGVQFVHHTRAKQRGSSRATFAKNGLEAAVLGAGGTLAGFEEPGYDGFFAAESRHAESWRGPLMLPALVREVDHIVYLPRVSTHVLAGATFALKGAVGWLREDSRLELHREAATFLTKCAEIASAPEIADRIRLVMSDASKVITTYGPDFGYAATLDPGLIVASTNLAMHDIAAHGILSYARAELTPRWASLVDAYPGSASWMNRVFVTMIWGVNEASKGSGFKAPAHGRALDNVVIRRGTEIFSPGASKPDLSWTAEVPTLLRDAVVNA